MENKVIIKMVDNNPVVVFAGSKEKAEAILFRVIMKSNEPIVKNENNFGIEFSINETYYVNAGKKSVPVTKPVKYFLQYAYETFQDYSFADFENTSKEN